jgi:hypothetical protein
MHRGFWLGLLKETAPVEYPDVVEMAWTGFIWFKTRE